MTFSYFCEMCSERLSSEIAILFYIFVRYAVTGFQVKLRYFWTIFVRYAVTGFQEQLHGISFRIVKNDLVSRLAGIIP